MSLVHLVNYKSERVLINSLVEDWNTQVFSKIKGTLEAHLLSNLHSKMIINIIREKDSSYIQIDFLTRGLTESLENLMDSFGLIHRSICKEEEVICKGKTRYRRAASGELNRRPSFSSNFNINKVEESFQAKNKEIRWKTLSLVFTKVFLGILIAF